MLNLKINILFTLLYSLESSHDNLCILFMPFITQCIYFFYLKIMTAVTSQKSFSEMIKEIPPGHAKDLVLRLCGQAHRLVNLFWSNILLTWAQSTCIPIFFKMANKTHRWRPTLWWKNFFFENILIRVDGALFCTCICCLTNSRVRNFYTSL